MLHVYADKANKVLLGFPERLPENWKTIFGIKGWSPSELADLSIRGGESYKDRGLLTLAELASQGYKPTADWIVSAQAAMCRVADDAVEAELKKGAVLKLGASYSGPATVKIDEADAVLPLLATGLRGLAEIVLKAPQGDSILRTVGNDDIRLSQPEVAVSAALQALTAMTTVHQKCWDVKKSIRSSTSIEALAVAAEELETYYMAAFKR